MILEMVENQPKKRAGFLLRGSINLKLRGNIMILDILNRQLTLIEMKR